MAESNNPSSPSQELQVPASVSRVADIPVVKSALSVATDWYGWVKGYNPVVESGLNRAEQTVLLVAGTARPVIQKLEKPSKSSSAPFRFSSVCFSSASLSLFHFCDSSASNTSLWPQLISAHFPSQSTMLIP